MSYDLKQFDFLDLGSKNGGSIRYCAKFFRTGKSGDESRYAKGIGIDIDEAAVKRSIDAGYPAIKQDILKLDVKQKFKFVTALDFLEHMPTVESAGDLVKKMTELADDFIFIRHPSFEDDEYLRQLGLRTTWSGWPVHTAHIKLYDYLEWFNKLGLTQYCIRYKRDLVDSSSEHILPLDAPPRALKYDKSHGKKPKVKFEKKVFSQIDIFVALKPIDPGRWAWITRED